MNFFQIFPRQAFSWSEVLSGSSLNSPSLLPSDQNGCIGSSSHPRFCRSKFVESQHTMRLKKEIYPCPFWYFITINPRNVTYNSSNFSTFMKSSQFTDGVGNQPVQRQDFKLLSFVRNDMFLAFIIHLEEITIVISLAARMLVPLILMPSLRSVSYCV